jgi:predicted NUDIX family NTP pyrophosphohydrolase
MSKKSAGILLYRIVSGNLELFLVHPGGPFWAKKDEGAWSLPKGEFEEGENPLGAARREFEEETGFPAAGRAIPLEPLRQPGGKVVHAWAMEGDIDPAEMKSNTFSLEWPPKSGKRQQFPEIDRGEWFTVNDALRKMVKGQAGFIDQLQKLLYNDAGAP